MVTFNFVIGLEIRVHVNFVFIQTGLLAHRSRRLTGELIVYPCSGVRRRRPQFQRSSPLKLLGQSCGASLGRGNDSLYKLSRSHDQDGCHGYK